MGGLRGQTGDVEATKSFTGHVELDERRKYRVVLDVEVFGRCHGDQGLDPGERDKATSWLLIGWRLFAEHVVNLVVGEACQRSTKPEKLSANNVVIFVKALSKKPEVIRLQLLGSKTLKEILERRVEKAGLVL